MCFSDLHKKMPFWFNYCFIASLCVYCCAQTNTLKFARIIDVISSLPHGCTDANGPHSIECLNSVWKLVGCFEEGKEYPGQTKNTFNPQINYMLK